jgi:hypothetical protein
MNRHNKNKIKGYICTFGLYDYYTDGTNVYYDSASTPSVVHVSSGYPQGRWECTVQHWNHYKVRSEGLPQIVRAVPGQDAVLLVDERMQTIDAIPADPFPETTAEAVERIEKKHNVKVSNWDPVVRLFIL